MKFENKKVKVENNKITFKNLLGSGDSYSTSMIMNIKEQKFGFFGKILGLFNMAIIIGFPYGLHQFKNDVLVKLKIQENSRATPKDFQFWLTQSEYEQFMKAIE